MVSFNASVDLPPTPLAPGAARRVLAEFLAIWEAPHSAIDAGLLVNELVSNAVEHVGGALRLQVSLSGRRLRVALTDGSPIHPVLLDPPGLQPRGRGMRLIAAVANRWGSESYRRGKRVWFELVPAPEGPIDPEDPEGAGDDLE